MHELPACGPVTAPRVRLLLYGDSLTAGCYGIVKPPPRDPHAKYCDFAPYGVSLCEELAGINGSGSGELAPIHVVPTCVGLCGFSSRHMVLQSDHAEIVDNASRKGPGLGYLMRDVGRFDLALIMAGTNDLPDKKRDAVQIFRDIQRLHATCHAAGLRSVVLSVPTSGGATVYDAMRDKRHRVNTLLQAWACDERGVLGFIDTDVILPFVEGSGQWEPDALHFSKLGYQTFGHALAHAIRPLLADLSIFCGTVCSVDARATTTTGLTETNTTTMQVPEELMTTTEPVVMGVIALDDSTPDCAGRAGAREADSGSSDNEYEEVD